MKGRVTFIGAGGGVVSYETTTKMSLAALQRAVAGYIEAVPNWEMFEGQPCVAYCNEEGKLDGLASNELATRCWREDLDRQGGEYRKDEFSELNGDIIILTGDDEFLA